MPEASELDDFEFAFSQLSEERRSAFVEGEDFYAKCYNELVASNPQHEPTEAEIFSAMSEFVDVYNYARALRELESRLVGPGEIDQ